MKQAAPHFWFFQGSLFALLFCSHVQHMILIPITVEIANSTGFPVEKGGLLIAIGPAASTISAFLLAPFSDRWGRRCMILLLSFGLALSSCGLALAATPTTLLASRFFSGFFAGPILSNCIAYASDMFPDRQRDRAIANFGLSFALVPLLGVPLGAWLGELFSWRYIFFGITVVVLVLLLVILRLPHVRTGAENERVARQYGQMLDLLRRSEVRVVLWMQFFMQVGFFGFAPNVGVWLSTNYGMTPSGIGFCYMQGGVASIAGNFCARFLLNRGWRLSCIAGGSLVLGTALVISTHEWVHAPFVGASFAGIMLGLAVRFPALQAVLSELTSIEVRGRLMAWSMILVTFSLGFGGLWSSWVLSLEGGRLEGMDTIGLIACGTLLLVQPMVLLVSRRLRIPEDGKGVPVEASSDHNLDGLARSPLR